MTDLSITFAALGDPNRFAIVERLMNEGNLHAGALHDGVTFSAPALSRHLKVLRKAGIIEQRVDKQKRIYSVRPQAVQAISSWALSHREFWENSLDRLELALMEEKNRK